MNTIQKLKDSILETLCYNNGVSDTRLVMFVMTKVGPTTYESYEYKNALQDLIDEGKLLELLYFDGENQNLNKKRILFLKETTFMNIKELAVDNPLMAQQSQGNIQIPREQS
jgi:hypothetical protein